MNSQDNSESLEMQESVSIRVEEPISTTKTGRCFWIRRFFNINDGSNEKYYRPVFIIFMCILHIFIHIFKHVKITWNGQDFERSLTNLFMFFLPCMRPTPHHIRIGVTSCNPPMKNITCSYDDELKSVCFSFMYPHQLWRLITVNLIHINFVHLFSNLFAQCLYGITLERKYGSARIAVIYWLSNVGACLSFMLAVTSIAGIGSSGAVYGLRLFFIVDRCVAMQRNPDRRLFIFIQLVLLVLLPFLIMTPIRFILNLKFNIGHSAHLGGGLVGFLCGIYMLGCPLSNENCIFRTACRRITFVLLAFYYIIGLTLFLLIDAPTVNLSWYKLGFGTGWTGTVFNMTFVPSNGIRHENFSFNKTKLKNMVVMYPL